ncbi:hypothetical protein D3093_15135 (plasmid) [Azospirillum argentinense]|uniref:Uncharacterized protein n=1 Tax=Azospirillum argentinense TaxID=2970906 RepID=A0A4D8PD14_9PROT|nr:hypothetical protein [Azospirillum argentinense]QCN96673.1 hypothetical protein D3093_15135 [Azospirillum argentinense]
MTHFPMLPDGTRFVPPPTSARFTRFDAQGRILGTGGCALSDYRHQLQPGDAGILPQGADLLCDYVDMTGDELMVRRRPVITSLQALPIPATVTVTSLMLGTSDTYEVTDGTFSYQDVPGLYHITVTAWPHLDASFDIEVPA